MVSAKGSHPPRLAARVVVRPQEYDEPFVVELRLLSASEVVDRFDVTVRAEFGVIPEPITGVVPADPSRS